MADLLIAGGSRDPNLSWLKAAADRLGIGCDCLLFDLDHTPAFSWSIEQNAALVDGRPLQHRAAFMRYDVFEQLTTNKPAAVPQALAWFTALSGLFASAGTFVLNRDLDALASNKPAMLLMAQQAGLRVPRTRITNMRSEAEALAGGGNAIAKPVAGGSYVTELTEASAATDWRDGLAPSPAIVQPRLDYPERRVYRVGRQFFVLDIASQTLDSRLDPQGQVTQLQSDALPPGVLDGLQRLTDRLRCDFCAVDMKTDPDTGELLFLELNNGPMFVAYDRATGGAMCEAMLRYLTGSPT